MLTWFIDICMRHCTVWRLCGWQQHSGTNGILDINTLRPRQHGRHFAYDTFKCIFLNENVWTPIKISLKFVPKGPINNIPALVQIMAWRRPGDKPFSEPMMVSLPTHICVVRSQWVKHQTGGLIRVVVFVLTMYHKTRVLLFQTTAYR